MKKPFLLPNFHFITIDEKQRDWLLWGAISLLIAYGMVMFFSVSIYLSEVETNNPYFLSLRQFSILFVGLIAFFVFSFVPTQKWEKHRLLLGLSAVLVLVLVLFVGDTIKGSKRWLSLGSFNFQVTEYIKLIYIIYLAGYINKFRDNIQHKPFSVFFVFILPTGIVCSLLIFQPDLGTTAEIIFFYLRFDFYCWYAFVGSCCIGDGGSCDYIGGD